MRGRVKRVEKEKERGGVGEGEESGCENREKEITLEISTSNF